jgi:hypothetical protein
MQAEKVGKGRWQKQAEKAGGKSRWKKQVKKAGGKGRWKRQAEKAGGKGRGCRIQPTRRCLSLHAKTECKD